MYTSMVDGFEKSRHGIHPRRVYTTIPQCRQRCGNTRVWHKRVERDRLDIPSSVCICAATHAGHRLRKSLEFNRIHSAMPTTVVNLLFRISIDSIFLYGSVKDCGYVLVENKIHAVVIQCADGQSGPSIKTIIS